MLEQNTKVLLHRQIATLVKCFCVMSSREVEVLLQSHSRVNKEICPCWKLMAFQYNLVLPVNFKTSRWFAGRAYVELLLVGHAGSELLLFNIL